MDKSEAIKMLKVELAVLSAERNFQLMNLEKVPRSIRPFIGSFPILDSKIEAFEMAIKALED
jgi:hypothetical protein